MNKEPKEVCLSEDKASHSQNMSLGFLLFSTPPT